MKKFLNKIKEKKELILEIIIIILIALFCYSVAPKTFQNDTYYTVTIGNLILENGIDMKDHFSWHEDLPYTYPHWLYDVIMSLIYNLGEAHDLGGWGAIYISVCVLSVILGLIIYRVNKKLNKNQIISFALTIGSMYLIKDYVAARAQLVTFIIFIFIIYSMEKFLEEPKKIHYAIGMILASALIANLHVAVWPFIFVLSLPYIAEYIVCLMSDVIIYQKIKILLKKIQLKIFKKNERKIAKINQDIEKIHISNEKRKKVRESEEPYKIRMRLNKNAKWLILVMLICALTGLTTPTGTTAYTYLYKTMIGNTVNNINEHSPLTLIQNTSLICVIIIVLSLLIFTKVKIRLSDLLMIGGLAYLMFSSKRQTTMFVLMGSIILNRMIMEAIKIYGTEKLEKILFKQFLQILFVGITCLTIIYSVKFIKKKIKDPYVSASAYPVDASNWILDNLDIHNIRLFNEYNYGSYLLYKGIPVFIDSRADLYAPEFNEKEDIFMDFINTSNIGTYYGKIFEKYDITHVILYKNAKIAMIIDKTEPENYNKIYSDNHFVIYEVVNNSQ